MGSRKHGRSGHASKSPRFRLWARLDAERRPERSRPKATYLSSIRELLSRGKPRGPLRSTQAGLAGSRRATSEPQFLRDRRRLDIGSADPRQRFVTAFITAGIAAIVPASRPL